MINNNILENGGRVAFVAICLLVGACLFNLGSRIRQHDYNKGYLEGYKAGYKRDSLQWIEANKKMDRAYRHTDSIIKIAEKIIHQQGR